MSELTYFLLKMAFLGLMWFFVFAVVFAIRTDLFGPRVRVLARAERKKRNKEQADDSIKAPKPKPNPADASILPTGPISTENTVATATTATRLTILEGPRAGHEFLLSSEPITIGRSLESSLVLRDDYTSTNHARIFLRNDVWMLEDQGSTNGTLLAGTRVSEPIAIPLDTPITVGTSVLELRR